MDCSASGLPVHHYSQSLLKLMSIESVMPSNHLILTLTAIIKMNQAIWGQNPWGSFPCHILTEEAAILLSQCHSFLHSYCELIGGSQIGLCWHHCQYLVWLLSANGISFGRCYTH